MGEPLVAAAKKLKPDVVVIDHRIIRQARVGDDNAAGQVDNRGGDCWFFSRAASCSSSSARLRS